MQSFLICIVLSYRFETQGVWSSCADGTDINTLDRDLKFGLLATGDDNGLIKLFRYPCVEKGAMYQSYRGHSSHVCCLRFTNDHRFLISTGGDDKTIIQWRHEVAELDDSSSADEADDSQPSNVCASDIVHIDRDSLGKVQFQVGNLCLLRV